VIGLARVLAAPAALAAMLVLAAVAGGEPSTLVASAGDSGTGRLGSGFDSGVTRPKKLVLKVKVKPNVAIHLEYDVFCRGGGERDGYTEKIRTRSRRIRLALPIDEPRGCLVYAFGSYAGKAERAVKFRIELRAKELGYQPPPPEPIDASRIRARLKVDPSQVPADEMLSIRAIGRDAHKFITGIDLRLDRPTSDGGWEPSYLIFADTPENDIAGDPVPLPPPEPILILLIGYEPTTERFASLEGVAPGHYRLRMTMSPDSRGRFPDNVRLYRELDVLPPGKR
jgi:hypothetical protein